MAESMISKTSKASKASSSSSSSSKYGPEMTPEEQYSLPTKAQLDEVGELPILDQDGNSHKFRSLWDRKEPTERRNIIVFIRHFFCGSCQEYVRNVSAEMSTAGLYLRNPPSTLTVIGCGDPALIGEYVASTNCQFATYADPSRAIFVALGMTCNFGLGEKPDYIKKSFMSVLMSGMWNSVSNPTANAGKKNQNGGEWIFVDGELKWCRRMRNTRDHTEIQDLIEVLDSQKETGERDGKYAEVYQDSMAPADEDDK